MKKILVLLLSLIMLVTIMASCSSDDDTGSDTTDEPVTDTDGDTAEDDTNEDTDTEAAVEPEAPPQEAETEPEPEPEAPVVAAAPKEYEYTSVFKVDFTTMEEGEAPFTSNNIDELRIEGGLLKGTSTGGDPYAVYTGEMALDASIIQEVHIKLMNYSEDFNFQFFFTTETVSWSEGASVKDYLLYSALDDDDNEWNEIVIYTEESFDWEGTITSFRLDPFSAEGDFEIEYVEFFTVTEK